MADYPLIFRAATRRILTVFLESTASVRYGYELARHTEMATTDVYRTLEALERAGWLRSAPEMRSREQLGRQPRVNYRLTESGLSVLRASV